MNDKSKEQLIDCFPYPIAIFTKQYTLVKVNRAFSTEAKLRFKNQEKSTMRILQYKIKDTQLAVAVVKVFDGNTFFLEGLNNPFSMFSGFSQQIESQLDRFDRAVIFPVSKDNSKITHGVIVFMS